MTTPIKTRADGSIDTAHYIRHGRHARSQAAHDMFRTVLSPKTPVGPSRRMWLLPVGLMSLAAMTLPYLT